MRAITMIAVVTLGLGCSTGAALAEPADVKSDSGRDEAAKAKSLNRMSIGVYSSLRTGRSNRATSLNAESESPPLRVPRNYRSTVEVQRAVAHQQKDVIECLPRRRTRSNSSP